MLPPGALLKIPVDPPARPTGEKRAALVRKGNELFNKGEIDLAKRIFLTTRYSDGLIRIGDHYSRAGMPLEALRAYWLAPCPEKAAVLIERISQVMKQWLAEGTKKGTA